MDQREEDERGVKQERYEAKGAAVFFYDPEFRRPVTIVSVRGRDVSVPVEALVQFVEEIYHGSEIPTAKEE